MGGLPALSARGRHLSFLLFLQRQSIFAWLLRQKGGFPTFPPVILLVALPSRCRNRKICCLSLNGLGFSFSWKQDLGNKCCVLVPRWQPVTSFVCVPLQGVYSVLLPCSHFSNHYLVEAHEEDFVSDWEVPPLTIMRGALCGGLSVILNWCVAHICLLDFILVLADNILLTSMAVISSSHTLPKVKLPMGPISYQRCLSLLGIQFVLLSCHLRALMNSRN